MYFREQSKLETEDFIIQQFYVGELSQFSYLIESNKEAIIIDPIRDIDHYLTFLYKRGAKLNYIVETHIHADFVSGHIDLNRKTSAQIAFGCHAKLEYDSLKLEDESIIELGNIKIKILHTPGHTLESISLLLHDKENAPIAIFTGDFLFLNEVGRPDLAVNKECTIEQMAGMLYKSIQKIKKLPDDVIIFPGHGVGSQCGFNISEGFNDSLGNQRKSNYALIYDSESEFINRLIRDIQPPPEYYYYVVKINKTGYSAIEEIVNKSKNRFEPANLLKLITEDVIIIDGRDTKIALKAFLKGSYLITINMQFCSWVAKLFKNDQKLVLIVECHQVEESIKRIARVGFENVIGFIPFDDLNKYCLDYNLTNKYMTSVDIIPRSEIKHVCSGTLLKYALLDVREENEWKKTGIVRNSHLISLSDLEANISYIKTGETNAKIWAAYCKIGTRGAVAASILKKYDFDVAFLNGVDLLKEHGVEFIPYNN